MQTNCILIASSFVIHMQILTFSGFKIIIIVIKNTKMYNAHIIKH